MVKTLENIKGYCFSCKHYEYVDSKGRMDGSWWHWGYCHRDIPRDSKDTQEQEDLACYFEVAETDYCSNFKERLTDD